MDRNYKHHPDCVGHKENDFGCMTKTNPQPDLLETRHRKFSKNIGVKEDGSLHVSPTTDSSWEDLDRTIDELIEQVAIHGGARNSDVQGIKNVVQSLLDREREELVEKVRGILRKWEEQDIAREADGAFFFAELKTLLQGEQK